MAAASLPWRNRNCWRKMFGPSSAILGPDKTGGAAFTSPSPSSEIIERLTNGVYSSFAMLAGMQLDVFTPLKDGPMTLDQVADSLDILMA